VVGFTASIGATTFDKNRIMEHNMVREFLVIEQSRHVDNQDVQEFAAVVGIVMLTITAASGNGFANSQELMVANERFTNASEQ
jgi:hypothetical protein